MKKTGEEKILIDCTLHFIVPIIYTNIHTTHGRPIFQLHTLMKFELNTHKDFYEIHIY